MPDAQGVPAATQALPSQQPSGQLVGVQAHAPFTHTRPAPQALPHAPQFPASASRFTHPPPHSTSPGSQAPQKPPSLIRPEQHWDALAAGSPAGLQAQRRVPLSCATA